MALNIYLHPQLRMVEAAALAEQLGCVLAWRGNRFVLRRRDGAPQLHKRGPAPAPRAH